jgi:hypothetical protein
MIPLDQLMQAVESIRPQRDDDELAFSVRPFPGRTEFGWVGRSVRAGVAFLVPESPGGQGHPAVSLPLIRVRHGMRVSVDDGASCREATVSLLECLTHEPPVIELFVRTVGSALLDPNPDRASVGEVIERLIELFRDYSVGTASEILGLWAELLVIAHCANPAQLTRQWRSHAGSRYDFGNETERFDVKATTSAHRQHELSFSQANPPPNVAAAFVSVVTEQVSEGTSVLDLWNRVIQLAPDSQHRIDRECTKTLGRDWTVAAQICFDRATALSTLAVYAATEVPRFTSLPAGVIRARFTADFGAAPTWQGDPPTPDGPIAQAIACVAER